MELHVLSYFDTQKGFYSHHFAHIRCILHSHELFDSFVLLASDNNFSCTGAELI